CECDYASDMIGKKIKKSLDEKVPYMLVVGEKEKTSGKLAVRVRGSKDMQEMSLEEFIAKLQKETKEKSL
ncbi:MAG: threonyl-tRNA synthetase, partial [Parcubacteria group bacterium Greene1014_20]